MQASGNCTLCQCGFLSLRFHYFSPPCYLPISVPWLHRSPFYLVFVIYLSPLIYCLLSPPAPNVVTKLNTSDHFSFNLFHYLHVLFLSFDCLFLLSLPIRNSALFLTAFIYFFFISRHLPGVAAAPNHIAAVLGLLSAT